MLIKNIKYKKKQAVITFESEELTIELDLVFKYNLYIDKKITLDEYVNLANESDYKYYYRISLEALKKSYTIKEMKDFLEQKNANETIIKKIISEFITKKYLDDLSYAKNYLEVKGYKQSFYEIEMNLLNKGISSNIISLIKNDYKEFEAMDYLLTSYLQKKKNTPKNKLYIDAKKYLLQKGFLEDTVDYQVNIKVAKLNVDEKTIIEKDFYKIYNRYKNNLAGKELITTIKNKLYKMGYKMATINDILKQIDE